MWLEAIFDKIVKIGQQNIINLNRFALTKWNVDDRD